MIQEILDSMPVYTEERVNGCEVYRADVDSWSVEGSAFGCLRATVRRLSKSNREKRYGR